MKGFICFCLLLFCTCISNAQTNGCQVGSTVYTSVDDLGFLDNTIRLLFGTRLAYKNSPTEPQTSSCVNNSQTKWVTANGGCRVCPGGYAFSIGGTGCNGTALDGFIVTKSFVYCNLDDYTFPLAAVASAFGVFMIRSRKIL